MLKVLVLVACWTADVDSVSTLVCRLGVSPPVAAAECDRRLAQALDINRDDTGVHYEGRCVAPGDPA